MHCHQSSQIANNRRQHYGFARLDVVVALAVLTTIIALLAPAVRIAREQGHQAECTNNLRQIGVGITGFEKTNGSFPATDNTKELLGSWIVGVLPHMGQKGLHDEVVKAFGGSLVQTPNSNAGLARKALSQLSPKGFHCPSDPAPGFGMTSYAACSGTWAAQFYDDGLFRWADDTGGPAYQPGAVKADEVTDGLSHTIAVSEWLHTWRVPGKSCKPLPRRAVWEMSGTVVNSGADIDTLVPICRGFAEVNEWRHGRPIGDRWQYGGCPATNYYHAMPPNSASCAPELGGPPMATAVSLHDGGVHGLFADGHVRFVSDSIDLAVWRAFGTRSGGEAVRDF